MDTVVRPIISACSPWHRFGLVLRLHTEYRHSRSLPTSSIALAALACAPAAPLRAHPLHVATRRVVGDARLNPEDWLVLASTPVDPVPGPVFSSTTACPYCDTALRATPSRDSTSTSAIDLACPDCGERFYADPAKDAELDTTAKLSGAGFLLAQPRHLSDEERRRRYRLARLAEHLLTLASLPPQQRGMQFEDAMMKLFAIEGQRFERSYRRGQGEQVDAALEIDGWHYLVECRWRDRPARWQEVMALQAQVRQSSRQTMGLFLSMNGWSPLAVSNLQRESQQGVLLMDGDDLRAVVTGAVRLADSVRAKARHLALRGDPYFAVGASASGG